MKGGKFRGFIAAMAGAIASAFGRRQKGATTYPDPILADNFTKKRKGHRTPGKAGRPRLGRPSCYPGTYTHLDWLVRHLGYDRRRADGWVYAFQNYGTRIPTPETQEQDDYGH